MQKGRSEDLELIPERDFWSRAWFVSLIPRPIRREYYAVKDRFGPDMANIVLFVYREYGSRAAKLLARRMLEFNSYDELVRFLYRRALRLGEGRELVARMIELYVYSNAAHGLADEYSKACPEARGVMKDVFVGLVGMGLYASVKCVRAIAEWIAKCRDALPEKCKRIAEAYLAGRGDAGGING